MSSRSPISASLPVGVLDSGVGGLTVLAALRRRLPAEAMVYLGDTARLPYGTKGPDTVTRYAVQAARCLVDRGVKTLVVACNTASALALPALGEAFPGLEIIGVLRPGAAAAARASHHGRIAVLATEGTVRGGAYQRAIRELRPDAQVQAVACPLFVSLAEEGWADDPVTREVARRYLEPLFADRRAAPDCLVLGCTHFPVLRAAISAVVGPDVALVDSAETTAAVVEARLAAAGLRARPGAVAPTRFLATDAPERFARVAGAFLEQQLDAEAVELVDL